MKTSIILQRDPGLINPNPTLTISADDVVACGLTVADRTRRNRSRLYQCKHDPELAEKHGQHTRQRPPELAALNQLIDWHRDRFLAENGWYLSTAPPILGIGIGDLTANPLRPHYLVAAGPTNRDRLFTLADEPIGEVEYSLLICFRQHNHPVFAILHRVRVGGEGELPDEVPAEMRKNLIWWAACPPLLIDGKHVLIAFSILDYDIRHVLGFPNTPKEEERFRNLYIDNFRNHTKWKKMVVREVKSSSKSYPAVYHAALGIGKDGQIIVLHREMDIPSLAKELLVQGAQQAVLLDTGGSPVLWANWAVSNGAILACGADFRPARGAVIFLALSGARFPSRRALCRSV